MYMCNVVYISILLHITKKNANSTQSFTY